MNYRLSSLACACVLSLTSMLAVAQPADGPDMSPMHHDQAKMAQMHARHMADLKSGLKLRADQESAWNTFTEAMKPPADMHRSMQQERESIQQLPTPERIDKLHALRKEHMAAMEKIMDQREAAIKTFYAALSPDQQKTFDHDFIKHHHGMQGMSDKKR